MKNILDKYSLAHLKKIVRRSNIVGYTKLNKDNLIKEMLKPQHKGNFKYLKKLKHDSADDRKNNMKLVDGDLKVRRDENKAKREANKKKKAEDLKAKVPALTEKKTAKKVFKESEKFKKEEQKRKEKPINFKEFLNERKKKSSKGKQVKKVKKIIKKAKQSKRKGFKPKLEGITEEKEEPKKEKKLNTAEIKDKRTQLAYVSNLEKRIKNKEANSMSYNKPTINRLVGYLKKKSKYLTDKYTDKQLNDFLKIAEPLKTEINTDRFSFDIENKNISDKVKKTKNVKLKKKEEPKKKVEIKKRVVKKKADSSMSNFKKSQEGKDDIDTLNEFYKNIRMGKSSIYKSSSDIKSIIKILKSNNQKVKDNFSDTRKEILLESAEDILEGLSSSKDKPKKEESEEEEEKLTQDEIKKFGSLKDISDRVKKTRNIKPKKPIKKKVEKPKSKPIVYKTAMMKKEEKKQAKLKQDKAVKSAQKSIDAFDKPKKKEVKPSKSTNDKKQLHAKYLNKFKSLQDKNLKVSQSQFEPKKEVDRDEIEEKIDKITKIIISLEEDIKKTDSTRLKDLLPMFIQMKKTYNLDLKN